MADFTSNVAMSLLVEGKLTHKWSCFGQEVIYDVFPIGTEEQIARQASGLDNHAKKVVLDVLDVAYALRAIAGYDFQNSLEEKLKFIRAMSRPMFQLFAEELRGAELKQMEEFKKRREELKKSTPSQL